MMGRSGTVHGISLLFTTHRCAVYCEASKHLSISALFHEALTLVQKSQLKTSLYETVAPSSSYEVTQNPGQPYVPYATQNPLQPVTSPPYIPVDNSIQNPYAPQPEQPIRSDSPIDKDGRSIWGKF